MANAAGATPSIPVASKGPPNALIIGGVLFVIIIIAVLMYRSGGAANGSMVVGGMSIGSQGAPPPAPPVNCVVSEWQNQGTCSKICGPGKQTQIRTVLIPESNGGATCPSLTQEIDCNIRTCNPVDCVVSDWSPYTDSTCTSTNKYLTRSRTIITSPQDYGEACPSLKDNGDQCNESNVQAICGFTTSMDTSRCSLDRNGAASGNKSLEYSSTVRGCNKPPVRTPCTMDDVSAYTPSGNAMAGGGQGSGGQGGGGQGSGGQGGGGQGSGGQGASSGTPADVVSSSSTTIPIYTCPQRYTFDGSKPQGSKCVKGQDTTAETATCFIGYTYNASIDMCSKVVYSPAPTPAFTPSPTPAFTPEFTPSPAPAFIPSFTQSPIIPEFIPSSAPAFIPEFTPSPAPIFAPSPSPPDEFGTSGYMAEKYHFI